MTTPETFFNGRKQFPVSKYTPVICRAPFSLQLPRNFADTFRGDRFTDFLGFKIENYRKRKKETTRSRSTTPFVYLTFPLLATLMKRASSDVLYMVVVTLTGHFTTTRKADNRSAARQSRLSWLLFHLLVCVKCDSF